MGMKHLDPTKPEDLAQLVATGLIWNGAVPLEYKAMAIDALVEGRIEPPDNLPAGTLDHINQQRNQQGLPPVELPGVGGEDPTHE